VLLCKAEEEKGWGFIFLAKFGSRILILFVMDAGRVAMAKPILLFFKDQSCKDGVIADTANMVLPIHLARPTIHRRSRPLSGQ
jgi:hypothetical protein